MKRINTYITEKFKIKKGIKLNEKYYTLTVAESAKEQLSKKIEKNIIGKYIDSFFDGVYFVYLFSISELEEYNKYSMISKFNVAEVPERLRDKIEDMKAGKFPITDKHEYWGTAEEKNINSVSFFVNKYRKEKR